MTEPLPLAGAGTTTAPGDVKARNRCIRAACTAIVPRDAVIGLCDACAAELRETSR